MQVYLEFYGSPARDRLQALVVAAKAVDPLAPVTVVPPNAYAGIGLRRVLAGDGGLLNVRFMALPRLAEQIGAPSMAAQHRLPLSAAVEMAVIRTLAGETAAQEPLGAVAEHPALHRSLRASFRELRRLPASELDDLSRAGPLQQATVDTYRRFRERTATYYDHEDEAWAAAEAVRSGRGEPALRDVGPLVFFLLSSPSPGETALLSALSDATPCSIVVGLTGEGAVDDAEGAWWERLDGASVTREAVGPLYPRVAPGAIVSAPDSRDEVRQVVRDMVRLAEDGVPFHRMAALYRRQDPYAFQLRAELGLAGIRVAGPDPSPLRDSVPARLLTGLLAVIRDDMGRAALMRWLAEAPVWNPAGNRSASGELRRWEGISREAGIVRGAAQWEERLLALRGTMTSRRQEAESRGEVSDAQARGYEDALSSLERLDAFVRGLALETPPTDGSPWSAFASWAEEALERYSLGRDQWPHQHRDALERLVKALQELANLDAVEPGATLSGFQQALDHALSAPVGRTGATGTGVFVAPLDLAAGMEFDTVWLLGMSEGDYPARAGEDPLLPETVGRALRQATERRDYLAALAAGRRRRLSYSRVDPIDRRPQYPSPWLLEGAAALAGERVSSEELNARAAPWLTVIESLEDALRLAEDDRAVNEHEYDVQALARWRRTGARISAHPLATGDGPLGRALAMERARAAAELTEWDGYLGRVAAASVRLGGSLMQVMAPTRLEDWATCPYRGFLGSVLGLSAWETPEDVLTISPLERGSLVHKVLERFIAEAVEAGAPLPGEDWTAQRRERLHTIAREEFRVAERRGVTGRRLLWEVAQEDILQDLDRFLIDDAQRRAAEGVLPRHAEYRFGFRDGSPVTMGMPDGGEVRFRGVIDRIDATPDGLRAVVVDYKTGRTAPYRGIRDAPLQAGKTLQLPVYALAARSALLPGASIQAEYWFVSASGGYDSIPVRLDEVEEEFRTTVQIIVEGMRGGVFPAVPSPSAGSREMENCRYCDFKRVCPTDRQALWARKSGAPQASPYVKLAGGPPGDDVEEDGE